MHRLLLFATLAATSCIPAPFERPDEGCDERGTWWTDTDGDGLGDAAGDVRIGCEDPGDGWTDVPPVEDTDTDDTDER